MIHVNYLIRTDVEKIEESKHFEISDAVWGIDENYPDYTRCLHSELRKSMEEVLQYFQKTTYKSLNFDIPPELPHIEIRKGIINLRQRLQDGDIRLVHEYFRGEILGKNI